MNTRCIKTDTRKRRWYCCFLGEIKIFEDFKKIISNLEGIKIINYKSEVFYDHDETILEAFIRDVVVEVDESCWTEGYRYLLAGFHFEEPR